MSEGRIERRLAAILPADVAGYSRLIGENEEGTLGSLRTIRREVIDPAIAEHRGRIVKTTGDGLLAEFQSVVDSVRCATAWQAAVPADSAIVWRIGIHQGDIVVENGDIFGDGVNVAARLEGLAEPGGICVSARVQEDAAGKLDASFEDLGEQSLKNIARPVRVYRVRTEVATLAPAASQFALPDKPSIAVLPFANLSGDPEQEYFADGMVEEIITALSRIGWLFVIARNSTFAYKNQAVDVKRVGRELGVRYVLEGSVRKGGSRIRVTGQLIEAESGTQLWADRFDSLLEDIFDLQDKVASSVAGVIEPALWGAEAARTASRPTADLTAYDLYLRAYAMFHSSARQIPDALGLLERAIARDPGYARALAFAAVCCYRLVLDGRSDDPAETRRKGIDYARRALEISGDDPLILTNAASSMASFGEDIGATTALVDRALSLNPNLAVGWHVSGMLRNWTGEPDIAIQHIQASIRLSPRIPVGRSSIQLGLAHFLALRFDEALPHLLAAIQQDASHPMPHRVLAACYAHLGRLEDAREIVTRLRAITPTVIPDGQFLRRLEQRELFLSGLRLAIGEPGSRP